tara:strand:- start:59 stop:370 length:312 start_codon:yes stop_codon:yes gene_type:complete
MVQLAVKKDTINNKNRIFLFIYNKYTKTIVFFKEKWGFSRRKKEMSLYCIIKMMFITMLSTSPEPNLNNQNQVIYQVRSHDSTYQNEIIYTKAPTPWVKVVNN